MSIVINSSNLKDILSLICTATIYHLHRNPSKSYTWKDTWTEWKEKGVFDCNTVRALATILYGSFNRNEHDIGYIIDTFWNNLTELDQYFSFDATNDYGEQIIIFRKLILNNDEYDITNVYHQNDLQKYVKDVTREVDEYLATSEEVEPWFDTWFNYEKSSVENELS